MYNSRKFHFWIAVALLVSFYFFVWHINNFVQPPESEYSYINQSISDKSKWISITNNIGSYQQYFYIMCPLNCGGNKGDCWMRF